ncbi:MAG: hypothetical protein WC551_09495 [Patescibacteria group bacterium]
MISGTWDATAASVEIVAADHYRDSLTIQLQNTTQVYLGFGAAAVAGSSLTLITTGDSITVRGHLARQAVYAIGNGASGAYQEGNVVCDL